MLRRDFLKAIAAVLAPLPLIPVSAFVPPRNPYIQMGKHGLMGLVSHLGVLPVTTEINICEGRILDIDGWDGTGYPVLVENACTFGSEKPRAWIYDFDLWNFRDLDHMTRFWARPETQRYQSMAAFYAHQRFGDGVVQTIALGGGSLSRNGLFVNRELRNGGQAQ
mgnify:CR=1 FL=1